MNIDKIHPHGAKSSMEEHKPEMTNANITKNKTTNAHLAVDNSAGNRCNESMAGMAHRFHSQLDDIARLLRYYNVCNDRNPGAIEKLNTKTPESS